MSRRRRVAVTLALLLAACGNLSSLGKGEPEAPEVLLHKFFVIAVELDQLKPMLFALHGKSFQPARVDDARAVTYFEELLRELGIPGRVVVRSP